MKQVLVLNSILIFFIVISWILIINLFEQARESLYGFIFPIVIIIISSIISIIRLVNTDYKVNDKEVSEKYQFISKKNSNARSDQITSLFFKKSFFNKIFNLGNFYFGIFGKSISINQQKNQNSLLIPKFKYIKKYKDIFQILKNKLNLVDNPNKESFKPFIFPKLFPNITFILIILFLGFLSDIFLFSKSNSTFLIYSITFIIIFILLITTLIEYLKLRSTQFIITDSYMEYSYNYIFGEENLRIPINKITNIEVNKNIISNYIFGIGSVLIFTGSSMDGKFFSIKNFNEIKNKISKTIDGKNFRQNTNIEIEEEKILSEVRAENSYLISSSISKLITFILGLTLFLIYSSSILISIILSVILLIILFIWFFIDYLYWRNFLYLIYKNKIIIKSGLININESEIKYCNIKNISLDRKFFFDKLLKQGNIRIFTAGTDLQEGNLISIGEYEKIYEFLKNKIK